MNLYGRGMKRFADIVTHDVHPEKGVHEKVMHEDSANVTSDNIIT